MSAAVDHPVTGGAARATAAGTPVGDANILPRSRPEEFVVAHVAPSVAVLLSALAAERGVSVTGMITILAVDAAEALGLGKLARAAADRGNPERETHEREPRDG